MTPTNQVSVVFPSDFYSIQTTQFVKLLTRGFEIRRLARDYKRHVAFFYIDDDYQSFFISSRPRQDGLNVYDKKWKLPFKHIKRIKSCQNQIHFVSDTYYFILEVDTPRSASILKDRLSHWIGKGPFFPPTRLDCL